MTRITEKSERMYSKDVEEMPEIKMFGLSLHLLYVYVVNVVWKGAARRNTKRASKPRNNLFTEIRGPKIIVTPKYDIKCFQYCTIKIIILRRLYDFIRSNA